MVRSMYLSCLTMEQTDRQLQRRLNNIEQLARGWKQRGLITLSLFQWERILVAYLETNCAEDWFDWSGEAADSMQSWPTLSGPRWSMRMPDIFHDGIPSDSTSWRNGRHIEKKLGSLARLKPDMVSSYVFYHYQAQEEKPEQFNKTYTIGLLGTLLFSYAELPAAVSENKPKGKLATTQTPQNWHEVMAPHFDPWIGEDGQAEQWRSMRLCITIE